MALEEVAVHFNDLDPYDNKREAAGNCIPHLLSRHYPRQATCARISRAPYGFPSYIGAQPRYATRNIPMTSLNTHAGAMTDQQIKEFRVDRHEDLEMCLKVLDSGGTNVFLWGTRGVGKTFLVRLIDQELRKQKHVVPASIDVLGLRAHPNPVTAFPQAVLLGLCTTIWKDVLNKTYSDLRARLDLREGDIRLQSKLARAVEKVYLRMMAIRKAHYEYSNAVGFSAGATGEKKELGWIEHEQPPILPFEFFEFCGELTEVLKKKGKQRIVMLCDEANLLPLEQQRDILSRYIDMFTARSVQFVFVAGAPTWESAPPPIPEGFDLSLELKGLQDQAARELLSKAARAEGMNLDADAIDHAVSKLNGNPRKILLSLVHVKLANEKFAIVSRKMMSACCSAVLAEEERYGKEVSGPHG